ncbi:GatB/YqeY domain-containing protein [Pseudazoarcus pumilus]|uniref:Glutamyl-tRNA amidotransferase n=1 Tax=Pseudazoarcus pumilus TaxID=2067960 RepID=A0A2I6S4S5_9RHOO|nr:GatB/YqeY domain-containing protein [Pseudazoarcus pumilus]AUN94262.1 glutamyl-tRNA amidotransferase [Pseudazoarcus pumilus]
MSLKDRIHDDMKAAMRAREAARLSALRLLIAAIRQREIDERVDLDEAGVVAIVEKLVKQRRDAAAQYEAAGREDLASAERLEVDVLSVYLPAALDVAELDAMIEAAIADSGAQGLADMGKAMGVLKPRVAGRADMAEVSRRVRTRLGA